MTDSESSDEERFDIGSPEVEAANKASAPELAASLVPPEDPSISFSIAFSDDLEDGVRETIFKIFSDNMKSMLTALPESSELAWNEKRKRKQIFNSLSRFILVQSESKDLVGFSLFRFEHEDEENMLYIYELQITQTSRRNGLGTRLMECLEAISKNWKMDRMKLTALKSNTPAAAFYKKLGFYAAWECKEYSILVQETA